MVCCLCKLGSPLSSTVSVLLVGLHVHFCSDFTRAADQSLAMNTPLMVSPDFIQLSHLTNPGLKPSFPPVPSFPLPSPNHAQFLGDLFSFPRSYLDFPPQSYSPSSSRTHCSTFSSGATPGVFLKRLHSFFYILFLFILCIFHIPFHSISFIFLSLTICPLPLQSPQQ